MTAADVGAHADAKALADAERKTNTSERPRRLIILSH
jgi:hypothetical protein